VAQQESLAAEALSKQLRGGGQIDAKKEIKTYINL
jgi:hypothetical protein